jgi:hypothetical protein
VWDIALSKTTKRTLLSSAVELYPLSSVAVPDATALTLRYLFIYGVSETVYPTVVATGPVGNLSCIRRVESFTWRE